MPWLLFYAYHTDEHLQLAGAHDTTHKHSLNCEKIYPAQAKRVRRAPDRYSVEEAPSMHRSASEEQRRLADQLHRSHPPRTHSGLSVDAALDENRVCPLPVALYKCR